MLELGQVGHMNMYKSCSSVAVLVWYKSRDEIGMPLPITSEVIDLKIEFYMLGDPLQLLRFVNLSKFRP